MKLPINEITCYIIVAAHPRHPPVQIPVTLDIDYNSSDNRATFYEYFYRQRLHTHFYAILLSNIERC